ncbi:unnamed protein product [marine sediment metagenome]|uniref:Uncharacterized protein n=1 Tax=marine sediment metagenome TaxID=412755 RepID=X1M723_9ZZZZ
MTQREQLACFVERTDELKRTRLIRHGFHYNSTMSWNKMRGLKFTIQKPDEDDLRSFLLTFRQFVANDEPIFMPKIYNIVHQFSKNKVIRNYAARSRNEWKKSLKAGGFKLIYNNKHIEPEYIANLWLNGYYFHNDSNKQKILKELLPHEEFFVRTIFLDFLIECTRQILYLGYLVKVGLREDVFKTTGRDVSR